MIDSKQEYNNLLYNLYKTIFNYKKKNYVYKDKKIK